MELLNYFRVVQKVLLVLDLDEPISQEVYAVLEYWNTHHPQLRIVVCSQTIIDPNTPYVDVLPLRDDVISGYLKEKCPQLTSMQIQQLVPYIEGIPLLMVMVVVQLRTRSFSEFLQKQVLLKPDSGWHDRMGLLWGILTRT